MPSEKKPMYRGLPGTGIFQVVQRKENEMKRLAYSLFLALLVPSISTADNTFPVGEPVSTQAFFCFDKDSAKVIADNKGDVPDALIAERKCALLRGEAVYVKEVYRKDEWSVWELWSRNIPVFYEATNWKPIPTGISI